MADNYLAPLGPMFGPNSIQITINDQTGLSFPLEVYPDANNPALKANGLQMHYYFQPQRVYLARKQDSPADYDFGATIFKGLMTAEDTVAITDAMTEAGEVSEGGGFCVFSTTFKIPDPVIQDAIKKLQAQDYPKPPNFGVFGHLFQFAQNDPPPQLGIVPIIDNNVTIEIPMLDKVGSPLAPMWAQAQGMGKGSIEATSISSFLVTMNMLAAGALVGSLKQGKSPFTVHYNLQEQFYINGCHIEVFTDVDKIFQQFSGAVSAGGFLGIDSASLEANYQSCMTNGGITTVITMDGANVPDDLKKMMDQEIQEIQQHAWDLVKHEIFDWTPTPDAPASASRGLFSSLFGGASVSLKSNYQKHGVHFHESFDINMSVTKLSTAAGDLSDLEPAIRANLDKYLAIVDIGEYFKKIQVSAMASISWSQDPIESVQLEVSYPNFDNPVANGKANLQTQANGFHYVIGHKDPRGPSELAVWTKDNPNDIVNVAFLRLDKAIPQWDSDQVQITKTVVYNPHDARVELSDGGSTYTKQAITKDHAPKLTADEVGYVAVKFILQQKIPSDSVGVILTCQIGNRKDTIQITKANQGGALWEIYSDKYSNETSASYTVQLTITGPNFLDPPVVVNSPAPIPIPLSSGRVKPQQVVTVTLPRASADDLITANQYILAALAPPKAAGAS